MNTLSSLLRILFRVAVAVASAIAVALVLAIVLVAIPLTRNFIISILAGSMLSGHLESLAVDLDIQPNLRRMFTLVVSLPIGFGIMQMIAARSFSKAWRGLAVALGTVLTLAVTVWWHTRHFNFDSNGNPIVYVSFDRDGVRKSYSDGIDRVTGRPKYQITVERVAWLSKLAQQEVREVDPATDRNWFDPNSGEPNFWYVQTCTNQWQFFNRPMFHPQLRVMASPVTPELMGQWSIEHQRLEAIKEAVRRREEVERKAAADRAENEKRIRAEQARLAFERHKAELAAAEAERQRKETEAKAAAEAERKRQEAEAEARRLAEEKARQQDAERLRQQEVVARMIRESSLAPSD
ncbi:MAG: hypothetical protein ACXWDN_02650, partial [Limisphaerales bacterium]